MALHFPILVNGRTIGYVEIMRLDELVDGRPSRYQVTVEYPLGVRREAGVTHLYDRGALSLIITALRGIEASEAFIAKDIDRL